MKQDVKKLHALKIVSSNRDFLKSVLAIIKDEPDLESYKMVYAPEVCKPASEQRAGSLAIAYLNARDSWTPFYMIENMFVEMKYASKTAYAVVKRLVKESKLDCLEKPDGVYYKLSSKVTEQDLRSPMTVLIQELVDKERDDE